MWRYVCLLISASAYAGTPTAVTEWDVPYSSWDSPQIFMAVDGTNGVYSFSVSNRVAILDRWTPALQKVWSRVVHTNIPAVANLQVDANGNVWAGAGSNIVNYSRSGNVLRALAITDFTYGCRYLAASTNAVYVATADSTTGKLFKFGAAATPEWWRYHQTSALTTDSQGNVIATGLDYSANGNTVKITPAGTTLWSVWPGGDVSVGPNDSVYVCGWPGDAGAFITTKIEAGGAIEWQHQYTAPQDYQDRTARIRVDRFGAAYVAGISSAGYFQGDTTLVKYASDGRLLWVNRWKAAQDAYFQTVNDLALHTNGLAAVTGRFWHGNDTNQEIGTATLGYDDKGVRIFETLEGSHTNNFDGGRAVEFDPAGNLYVASVSTSLDTPWRYYLKRYPAPPVDALPHFTLLPTNTLATPGQQVTFTGAGSNAISSQWLRNDGPIPGATGNLLTLTNVQRTNAVDISLALSNSAGRVVSPVARLWFPPELVADPENVSVFAGDSAFLDPLPAGNQAGLTFEWWKNGMLVGSNQFAANNVAATNYGDYTLRVVDPLGATTETAAWIRPPQGVDLLWSRRQMDASQAVGLAVLQDGSTFLLGYEYRPTLPDYFILKRYGPSGEDDWRVYYSPGQEVTAAAIRASSGGELYVAGSQRSARGDLDVLLASYDTNGTMLGAVTWDSGQALADEATGCAIDSNGAVYITARSEGLATGDDIAVLKVVSRTNIAWVARYSGPTNINDRPAAIALDPDGTSYITGRSETPDGIQPLTLSVSSAGTIRWARIWNSMLQYHSHSAVALDSTGVYAAGVGGVVKYNRAGAEIWARSYFGGRQLDTVSVCLGSTNDLYATGQYTWRLRTDNGAVTWVSADNRPNIRPRKLTFDPVLQQLYVATSARIVAGLRADDGVVLWNVTGADFPDTWAEGIDISPHPAGGFVVTSTARDGSVDCLTRRYLPSAATALPVVTEGHTLVVDAGSFVRLTNTLNFPGTGVQFHWKRNNDRLFSETNNAFVIPAATLLDDGLYSLEAWNDTRRWVEPAWHVVVRPTLSMPGVYGSPGDERVYVGADHPPGVTYLIQASSNLNRWETVFPLSDYTGWYSEPVGSTPRFFRAVVE